MVENVSKRSLSSKRIGNLYNEWENFHSDMDFDRFVELHCLISIENHLYSISNFGFGNSKRSCDED
jgi:hypothetical protein